MKSAVRLIENHLRRRKVKVLKPFGKSLESDTLRLSLCDTNEMMADVWREVFRDVDAVEVAQGDILALNCDALVSPANSFGDMSGGIDRHIDDFYAKAAQPAVMSAIHEQFMGELPVGMALIVSLASPRFPFLIAAPTMRVPGSVADTVNAYLAFRAVLVAVLQHNDCGGEEKKITSVAVPGLCTGVGGMIPGIAARQMRAAYDNIIGGGWREVVHPAMAPYAMDADSGKTWSWSKPSR